MIIKMIKIKNYLIINLFLNKQNYFKKIIQFFIIFKIHKVNKTILYSIIVLMIKNNNQFLINKKIKHKVNLN